MNRIGKDIFEDLMVVSNVRGRIGAGMAIVYGKDQLKGVKSLYSGCDLLDMKGYGELIVENGVKVLLGHTRWPTKGATNDYNNVHPHFMKTITGVHNGTLDRVDGKSIKGELSDSYEFYKHANEVGFEKALGRATGAYAFVFIDHATRTLNFIRNTQRPMWLCKHNWGKDSQSLMWASEKAMLVFALTRKDMLAGAEFVELPINELWTIPYNIPKGSEFEVESCMYGGSDLWRPQHKPVVMGGKPEERWPFRGGQIKGTGVDSSTSHPATTTVGRETYVFRNGEFVAKSTILTSAPKQVSLRPSEGPNEPEGGEAVRLPNGEGDPKGTAVKQRQKAAPKISLGNSGSTFLKNLTKGIEKHLSKDEQEFNMDIAGPDYDRDNRKIEEEFEKLLAMETDGTESVLWDDCQYEDSSDKLVETMKGYWIPEKDYQMILQNGCVWTGDPATASDDLYWIEKESFIFRSVLNDPEAIRDLRQVYPNDPYFMETPFRKGKDIEPHHVTMH